MSKKSRMTLFVVILVAAAITTGIIMFVSSTGAGSMPAHITVTQAKADTSGLKVKVGGDVVPGSVSWDNASRSLNFTLAGEGDQLTVVYKGVAPNDFRPGSQLLVEGMYSPSGIFQATSLVTATSPLCKACHG